MIKNNDLILASDMVILREFMEHDWADVHQYASQEIVCQYQIWGQNTEEDSKEFIHDVLEEAKLRQEKDMCLPLFIKES